MSHRKKLAITIFSTNENIGSMVSQTLIHAYPDIKVYMAGENHSPAELASDIAIVDTACVKGPKLDHVLDSLPDIPVIIVVDGMNDVHNLRHLLVGRRELITQQGLSGLTLIQSVHHLLDRQRLHDQLQKTAQHLKDLSIRDDMTKLFNHRHFNDILTQEVKKSIRYQRPLGLVMIALKNFTAINETYGHHEGDRLLARAAGILNATVRDVDITARYGDNEFAVILPETDEDASLKAGERIFAALSQLTVSGEGMENPIAVSVGIAALSENISTKKDLLKAALRALIEAKRRHKTEPIMSASAITSDGHEVAENRRAIEQLCERVGSLGRRAERAYFQDLLKSVSEIPVYRKYFGAHADRVAFYAERLAAKLGLGEEEIRPIRRASLLHDVGKLAIDMEIINKADKLSTLEFKLMRKHPTLGTEIVGSSRFLQAEPEIILHHHERFDGGGYPEGIAGQDISLGARIVALAEAWDTMINPQPYRTVPLSFDAALAELKKGAGTQFDPNLVETFTALITG